MGKVKAQKLLTGEKPAVLVDKRELQSRVVRCLEKMEVKVIEEKLKVGDYIISEDVAVERKTIKDFLSSVVDGRVFDQLKHLSQSYRKPVLIMEGNPELLYLERDIHSNAVRGALSSIALNISVPIIWTRNAKETACMLRRMAFREQIKKQKNVSIRSSKKAKTLEEEQEFLVAGLPNVNSKLGERLLKHFGSPKDIFTATVEELMKVESIGEKKAKKIWEVLNEGYS